DSITIDPEILDHTFVPEDELARLKSSYDSTKEKFDPSDFSCEKSSRAKASAFFSEFGRVIRSNFGSGSDIAMYLILSGMIFGTIYGGTKLVDTHFDKRRSKKIIAKMSDQVSDDPNFMQLYENNAGMKTWLEGSDPNNMETNRIAENYRNLENKINNEK
ncbi:hypothetical protein GOV14_03995, partial [Candidatus Pacearchaeota archaeon]|nr:hypothetical protein [Candidatus Pacearchaeota archaeon]